MQRRAFVFGYSAPSTASLSCVDVCRVQDDLLRTHNALNQHVRHLKQQAVAELRLRTGWLVDAMADPCPSKRAVHLSARNAGRPQLIQRPTLTCFAEFGSEMRAYSVQLQMRTRACEPGSLRACGRRFKSSATQQFFNAPLLICGRRSLQTADVPHRATSTGACKRCTCGYSLILSVRQAEHQLQALLANSPVVK